MAGNLRPKDGHLLLRKNELEKIRKGQAWRRICFESLLCKA